MPAWARWTVVLVLLGLAAAWAGGGLWRTEFGNCATPEFSARVDAQLRARDADAEEHEIVRRREAEYLKQFDARLEHVEYDCVERVGLSVATTSGAGRIRLLHDRNGEWASEAGAVAEFERGVRAAAEAIARLGGVDLEPEGVTILLADDFPRDDRTGAISDDIGAYTERARDDECRIVVYLLGPGGRERNAAFLIAHELFHCVQTANLSQAQMQTSSNGEGGGGDWWLEGSAEWFAALALPDAAWLAAPIRDFDAASPTTPLNRMAYEAVVFFLWLGQERAPTGVMDFLRGMAGGRSDAAQHAAMAAMGQDRWLDFAEAYLDGRIRHPHGTAISMSPQQGDIWQWSATRTQNIALEPFVLRRGVVAFDCGRWRTAVRPEAMHSARPEDGGAWGALPAAIDTTSGSGGSYRLAAINATAAPATLAVQGTMEAGCGDCLGVTTTDTCLVGTWRLTGGGSIEWMRSQGIPITSASMQNDTITFHRGGGYVTGAMEAQMRIQQPRSRADGQGSFQGGGRWSTREGVLNMCADMQAVSGQVTVTDRYGSLTGRIPPVAGPGNQSSRYTCSGNTLNTEIDMPGYPPMRSQFTRVGE